MDLPPPSRCAGRNPRENTFAFRFESALGESGSTSAKILLPLRADEVVEILPAPDHSEGTVLYPDFRRMPSEVVVRRHREAVRADVTNRQEVSLSRQVDESVPKKVIAALADRAHHVGRDTLD